MSANKKRILGLLLSCILLFFIFNSKTEIIKKIRRIGKVSYYVHITQSGKKLHPNQDTALWDYEYTIFGFNALKQKKLLTFRADHQLRNDAFLRVYADKKDNAVISWEEISRDKLPEILKSTL